MLHHPRRRVVSSLKVAVLGCGLALGAWSASTLYANPGTVKTSDGRTLEGDVKEQGDNVVVTGKGGIETTVTRANVTSIDYAGGDIKQQYDERLAKLKNPTAQDHVDLARWLLTNKAYDLAQKEADAAQGMDPTNPQIGALDNEILYQRRLDMAAHQGGPGVAPPANNNGGVNPGGGNPGGGATGGPPAQGGVNGQYHLLSPDDINFLKQSEWTSQNDTGVHVRVDGETKRKYVALSGENLTQFSQLTPEQQGWEILHYKDSTPELANGVRLMGDPAAFKQWRTSVQPFVLLSCATASCHGGNAQATQKLYIFSTAPNEATTYTNFYIMATYKLTTADGHERVMLDRTVPQDSLLLSMMLPAAAAGVPHPDVPKGTAWRGKVPGKDDAHYQAVNDWISHGLLPTEPSYPFDFNIKTGDVKKTKPKS